MAGMCCLDLQKRTRTRSRSLSVTPSIPARINKTWRCRKLCFAVITVWNARDPV